VAPVKVGSRAFTAAGSTIGHDVPDGALGIERAKQAEVAAWGAKKLEKYVAKKQKLEAEKKSD
jgi:bifunctional UDP-N-acetylglucosamine pyrophosphorylase/glucosamine-1-phosphate N-acetyltransferase